MEFANALERRIEVEGVATVFRATTGRIPSDDELEILKKLDPQGVARVLLNLDETVTRN